MAKNLALVNFFAGLVLILGSCSDQYSICDLEKNSFFKVGLYNITSSVETLTPAPLFTLTTIGGNSIYTGQQNISQFNISLNPVRDSIRFFIKVADTAPADTLTIVYATQTVMLSPECGNIYIHTVSNSYSTHNSIDSVRLVSSTVNTTSPENLRIFY